MSARLLSFVFFLIVLAPFRPARAADVLPQYESSTVDVDQANAATWRAVHFVHPFAAPPVVITGPVTMNDLAPVTVRVRNVTTTGFEYQMDEWDYLDGTHGKEKFSWLAVQTGLFQIGAVTWQVGRVGSATGVELPVSFASAFPKQPVLLAQVETTNNAQAVITRLNAVTATEFRLRIQAQSSDTATLSAESVGYVAATPGTAALDGAKFYVGRPAYGFAAPWRGIYHGGPCSNPNCFAQPQTSFNAAPVTLRQRLLNASYVQLSVQGEASAGLKPVYGEFVGYLSMAESQGEIRANLEFGSVTPSQPDRSAWYPVTFDQPYNDPIVVFGPLTENDPGPARVRVRNVSSTGFEFQVEEWTYEDGVHAAETVHYMVAEAGTYTIGGQLWAFNKVTGVSPTSRTTYLPATFPKVPVIFPQIVTTLDPSPVHVRMTAGTFWINLILEREKAIATRHGAETVHYLAITPSSGRMVTTGLLFDAAKPVAKLSETYGSTPFEGHTLANPFFFGETQSRLYAGPIDTRFRNLTAKAVDLRLEGEASKPPVVPHPPESYGFLTIAGVVDRDEDGMADDWELAHGLNPADPGDAALDPDGDGRSNLQEYLDGTDPQVNDNNGPLLTVSTTATDAYRKEGTAAKLRIDRPAGGGPLAVQFTMSGTAAPAEYRVTDAGGNTLVGSVSFAEGETTKEIDLVPIADGNNHYPESIALTLNAGGTYRLGSPATASANISDAAPTAANEQLFVAYLTRQGSANTYASGIGTLYLNGPKNSARVSLSFNGLTSAQVNAYIRYGIPGGVGTELRPTLGNGQVTNVVWSIVPAGIYSGQNIIDALFQKGGEYTYVNIGTGNYPVGEIAGTWTRQTGTTTFTPPADPPAIAPLTGGDLTRDVARFLTQATFGATQADIDALTTSVTTTWHGDRIAAFSAWIDQQLALPQTNQLDLVQAADNEEFAERGTDAINYTNGNEPRDNNRRRSWWTIAVKAPDELRQRYAFALSELLVISDKLAEVKSRHYGAAHYYDQLAAGTTGNYQTLLEDVSKSPMMGKYLSSLQNQKAVVDSQTGQILISPDENYAREIMQLFSIGLVFLHPDGSLQLAADGTPIQTYSNADITELARVFTGWSFGKRNGAKSDGYPVIDNTTFLQGNGPAYFQAEWTNPMKNFAAYHDTGAKTVVGQPIAGGLDGAADLSAAVKILFDHQNVGPFISRQLIQRLVTSNPSAGYVYRVGQKFENNGSGVRGDMKAVIKATLLDYEARTLDLLGNVGYGKQKEPIVRYLQLLRACKAKSNIQLSIYNSYGYPSAQYSHFPAGTTLFRYPSTDTPLGQSPLSAPTVFNWFLPDFNPGGAVGAAGLVAPELQLSTETGVVQAINYHYTLAQVDAGQNTQGLFKPANSTDDNIVVDRTAFEATYNSAIAAGQTVAQATATLLDAMDSLLTSGSLKAEYSGAAAPNPRSIILDSVSSLTGVTTTVRVKEMLYLVVTSPAYIHQK
ncbi:MAG TPA: DUF1800 family protein [Chthoniobacteraceae bacterium]|jgi:uncharacterized protein (DUF1800 family)|nr:DUF1800 family protein [Chthoniobacteraceae bacterium]